MDFDENNIFYKNTYIQKPNINKVVATEDEAGFAKYYLENVKGDKQKTITTQKQQIQNETTQKQRDEAIVKEEFIEKQIQNIISIDSRDRDKTIYPNANYFKNIFGQHYTNVKSVRLASIEFPNTSHVVNNSNNRIYWRNVEDIEHNILDPITGQYPIYHIELTPGSYNLTTLQNSIIDKMNLIKRRNNTSDYHYFQLNLDNLTDKSVFTSLTLQQLNNNPLDFVVNTTLITVNATAHGFANGDIAYIVGALTSNGVNQSILNTYHNVILINSDKFQIEINTKANATASGGGNTLRIGRLAPFQFLFGSYQTNSISSNMGFPLEDSSQRINFYIQDIVQFNQIKIDLASPHNLSRSFSLIGNSCSISGSGTSPSIDGFSSITDIPDQNTILIDKGTIISSQVYPTNATITINSVSYDIHTISNYTSTVKIILYSPHNYTFSDILTKIITLNSTTSTPSLDGNHYINSITAQNEIVIKGFVLQDIFSSPPLSTQLIPPNAGNFSILNPLTTKVLKIENVIAGNTTKFQCTSHGLKTGDVVKVIGLRTVPQILSDNSTGIFTISVIDANNFSINFQTDSFNQQDIDTDNAQIGTKIIECFFPYLAFGKIDQIIGTGPNSANLYVSSAASVFLQLIYQNSSTFVISQSNSVPSIDGTYLINSISGPNLNIISITLPFTLTSNGSYGIVGLNDDFYIYGATSVGGISPSNLNSTIYKVREIIDDSHFTFEANEFATFSETGGGNNIHVSSLNHGYNGVQTNEKNNKVFRSINLQGENYAFLCCDQLKGFENTNNVSNIFAKIILDQSPNYMVFNFINKEIVFDQGVLTNLQDFIFQVKNYDGTLYDFKDLDYSFTLDITTIHKFLKNIKKNKNAITTYD